MGEGTCGHVDMWTCRETFGLGASHVCICPILRRPSYVHSYNHTFTDPAAPMDVCVWHWKENTHNPLEECWRPRGDCQTDYHIINQPWKRPSLTLLLFYLPASVCRSDRVINGFVFKCSQHQRVEPLSKSHPLIPRSILSVLHPLSWSRKDELFSKWIVCIFNVPREGLWKEERGNLHQMYHLSLESFRDIALLMCSALL